ncbi:MAG: permease-like cell division protein FtsX [bacterium]|nr:permease-like cell division protein FtsX [bacterium]
MFTINLKRVFKTGYKNFHRNDWLSMATVLIMVLVLFVLGGLVFFSALAGTILGNFESKIDITVYFKPEAPEAGIFDVKKEVEALPQVADIKYISKEDALVQFKEKNKGNALILDSLNELGDNPLEAALNIRAKTPESYAAIGDFLAKKNYPLVDKINYFENQEIIERFGAILGTIKGWGAFTLFILAFLAVLVAFNTIRLAIYTMREEINIMRLVGAANWFVRGPFMVTGVIYGLVAALAASVMFFPLTWLIAPKLSFLVPQFNLFSYFIGHFVQFFGLMLVAGVALGLSSSLIAIRKYLRV